MGAGIDQVKMLKKEGGLEHIKMEWLQFRNGNSDHWPGLYTNVKGGLRLMFLKITDNYSQKQIKI